jgi:hypothetical protein
MAGFAKLPRFRTPQSVESERKGQKGAGLVRAFEKEEVAEDVAECGQLAHDAETPPFIRQAWRYADGDDRGDGYGAWVANDWVWLMFKR